MNTEKNEKHMLMIKVVDVNERIVNRYVPNLEQNIEIDRPL